MNAALQDDPEDAGEREGDADDLREAQCLTEEKPGFQHTKDCGQAQEQGTEPGADGDIGLNEKCIADGEADDAGESKPGPTESTRPPGEEAHGTG